MTHLQKRATIILATLALFAAMVDVAEAAKRSRSTSARQAQASMPHDVGGHSNFGGDTTLTSQIRW